MFFFFLLHFVENKNNILHHLHLLLLGNSNNFLFYLYFLLVENTNKWNGGIDIGVNGSGGGASSDGLLLSHVVQHFFKDIIIVAVNTVSLASYSFFSFAY